MQRRNLLLLLPLILVSVSCSLLSGQSAEQRMQNARTAALLIAPDLGIKTEDLLSEEEECNATGCYQQLYFSSALTDADLELRLTASKTYTWTYDSTLLNFRTDPYIDIFAKRIALVSGAAPVNTPAREWLPIQFVRIDKKRYIPRVALYLVSSVTESYTVDGKPLNSNVLRIFLKAS